MQKRAKNEVFGDFFKFGWFDVADTTYSDRWKWYSSTNGNQDSLENRSLIIMIGIVSWKRAKNDSFGQWLAPRMAWILHVMIKLNGLNNSAMVLLMLDHSKITKMHIWMIQIAKKEVFGHFLEFGLLDRLDIACFDSTECLTSLTWLTTLTG